VQARCNSLGFDCGKVDGINGAKTKAGVKGFQFVHGLEVDAIAGKKTKAKLKQVYGY
jgi:N-acetylmuramoyl-L-alanine amidase